ncbi:lytic murein transglycosylase B [Legionella resiliens]|uniref:Lytic murein transglycosylase B n=1 Tax=Legionella resiliens TaxID=2905958 RepID=A0ABS8X3A5_9GAMM|nr:MULTISPECIES: lytic murein transglycosylase B [unclassified Legionella]MCE0724098.1 lytic murein transglycosylase B [Legionella sp. 9fVS26]MCE3533251.1 lytic murein transglycosylase B [Legionella sp. 8cVS16]
MRQMPCLGFIAIILLLLSFSTYSNTSFTQRKDVQLFIKNMVKEYHFNAKELTAIMNQVVIQPDIIESMEKPYEKKNWDVYRDLFLTPMRVKGGLDYWVANRTALEKAEKKYGVPPEIIIAILGVETLYGERQGGHRVLDALATLAFNYPKRAPYFTKELKEYLLLCREHGVPATQYKGSYAGAIGQPQFMPSSYRNFAVDFNNTGTRDLVSNNADSIGSIANYFHHHGWKPNDGVAQHAKLIGTHYKRIQVNPKRANYHYSQLISYGIKPVSAADNHPSRAGLIELVTAKGNEYWIAYPNFFVITRYNSSPQYALVVYLLAQQLKQQWTAMNIKKHRAYA